MNIIAEKKRKANGKSSRRWEHPVRDKLEEVYCIDKGKTFTRPGVITQKRRGKKVDTARYNYGGKKLTENYLNGTEILAVRQMYKIKLLALDIDKGSKYRHDYVGIVHALEEIGLCRSVRMLSSVSGGLHIYFPLEKPVLSEFLHVSIKAWLQHRGFEVADGVLEIFPSANNTEWKRDDYGNWNIEHLARCFRLPLQEGSYVIDEDECIVHNDKKRFWLEEFDMCANSQDTEGFEEYLSAPLQSDNQVAPKATVGTPKNKTVKKKRGRPSRVNKEREALKKHMTSLETTPKTFIKSLKEIVKRGWTNSSQSNYLIGAVAILASYKYRNYDEADLAHVIRYDAMNMPGYQQYASASTKKDLEDKKSRSWSRRWAKSVIKYRARLLSKNRLKPSSTPSKV